MKDNIKNALILVLCATVAYLFFNQPEVEAEEPNDGSNLSGIITKKEALKLQAKYIRSRAAIFKDTFNYTDSRSYTMSLDKIEGYTKYIRTTYGQGEDKLPNLGLRFYLGAKPESSLGQGISTMFITATTTPDAIQKGGLFSVMQPSQPGNIPGAKIQDEVGNDNPPHNL